MKLIELFESVSGFLKLPYSVWFTGSNGRKIPMSKGSTVSYNVRGEKGTGITLTLVTSRGKLRLQATLSFDSEAEARETGFTI